MKNLREAWEAVDQFCQPLFAVRVELIAAFGRVVRENAVADTDNRPFLDRRWMAIW